MNRKSHKPLMPVRLARIHARLLISIVVGIAVALVLRTTDWRTSTKLLAGWDIGVICYLLLVYREISRAIVSDIRRRAAIQDEGAVALLLLSPAAAIASLAAVVAELGSPGPGWANFAIGMGTILLSWLFLHAIFAFHYAHEYYGERSDDRIGGLKFPGLQGPDYWDFLLFLPCHRDDLASVGRRDHQQGHSSRCHPARRIVLLFQCVGVGADCEHGVKSDQAGVTSKWPPLYRPCCLCWRSLQPSPSLPNG